MPTEETGGFIIPAGEGCGTETNFSSSNIHIHLCLQSNRFKTFDVTTLTWWG